MNEIELRRRLASWHHDRFDEGDAPERLRSAVLAIPGTMALPRGPVTAPRGLGRPLMLVAAAALLIGAMGGAMAIGRLVVVPTPDDVPVNFAGLNPCEVLGFGPTVGQERHRGSLELSDQLQHTTKVTSREFAAIRRGEQLRAVAPLGRCDYRDASGGSARSPAGSDTEASPSNSGLRKRRSTRRLRSAVTPSPRRLPPSWRLTGGPGYGSPVGLGLPGTVSTVTSCSSSLIRTSS